MERNINSLIGYSIKATDGKIGEVVEFYFDDETWAIRYLIINTIGWLANRKVLISPVAVIGTNWENGLIPVNLTSEQIRHSPKINTDKPVSRQQEIELHKHYSWGEYRAGWVYDGVDFGMSTPSDETDKKAAKQIADRNSVFDPHLHSTSRVTGYDIQANDGKIGHVKDFIFDDQKWQLKYFVVDTHHWIGGKKVLLPVNHIEKVDWPKSDVFVNLSVADVQDCKAFEHIEYSQG